MAINYTELMEDCGKRVLWIKSLYDYRSNSISPDPVDTLYQEESLLASAAAGHQSPEHGEYMLQLSQSYTSLRSSLDGSISQAFQLGRDYVLRGTMLSYMEENGTAPILSTSTEDALLALRGNMQIDLQTIRQNLVSSSLVTYDELDNQGDWGGNAWSASVALDVTGDHHQLIRSCTCTMEVTLAGYASQHEEELTLRGFFSDDPLGQLASPTSFIMGDHLTGTETEDVSLNSQGAQVPGSGTSVYTGLKATLKTIDPDSFSELNDLANGLSGYTCTIHAAGKSPFNRNNVTFVGDGSARNGTIYIRCDHTGGGSYAVTLYKDVLLAVPISQVYNFPAGADKTASMLVADSASSLFDGLSTGDTIMEIDISDAPMTVWSASFTVELGMPLPLGEGDIVMFSLTSDESGVFQSHFAQLYNFWLPYAANPGQSIPDTLAE